MHPPRQHLGRLALERREIHRVFGDSAFEAVEVDVVLIVAVLPGDHDSTLCGDGLSDMEETYVIDKDIYAFSVSAFSVETWEAALLGADPAVGVDEFVDALPVSERGTVELSAADLRESARRIAGQLTALRARVARQLEVRGVTDAITGVREPELIMDRLVVEARRLLAADLAYIATGDSDVRSRSNIATGSR